MKTWLSVLGVVIVAAVIVILKTEWGQQQIASAIGDLLGTPSQ
jgi:hypothetical protein